MRVALYTRVSTDRQEEKGYSLAQQEKSLLAYCQQNDHEIVEIISDTGSGGDLERKGIYRIRELADAHQIQAVIAQDRDRFSRDDIQLAVFEKTLERKGVKLLSVSLDTNNYLLKRIKDLLASEEKKDIAIRTARGRLEKTQQGKIANTRNYGFDYLNGQYEINPEE